MPIEETLCPECGGKMVSRKSQYGVFWGCANFPKCKGTRDNEGRSKADREKERIAANAEESVKQDEWHRNKEDKVTWNKNK